MVNPFIRPEASTLSLISSQGMKIVAAGTNPVQLTRGMDKTVTALVKELKLLSTPVHSDKDLADVASVSAGASGGGWGEEADISSRQPSCMRVTIYPQLESEE